MKLNKVEKIIVAVIVIGGILAAGIFMFIVPAYNKIGVAQKRYDALVSEKANLEAELSREATIDTEISDSQKNAKKLEGKFYPDITTYEASEIALAYLADNKLKTTGISVSDLSVRALSLETYVKPDVVYDLKVFSQTAKGVDENALAEGQFKDGNKVYTIAVYDLTDIQISDENGTVIEKSKYSDTMKKAYKQALCEYAKTTGAVQNVGIATATYSVSGTYGDYLGFIDYINNLDRATYIPAIVIPETMTPETDEKKLALFDEEGNLVPNKEEDKDIICDEKTPVVDMAVTVQFLCVEPMDELATIDAGGQTIVVNQ